MLGHSAAGNVISCPFGRGEEDVPGEEGLYEEGPRKPRARALWAGENSPVVRALQWCGWDVAFFSSSHESGVDLIKPRGQSRALTEREHIDAWYIEVDCCSLSKGSRRNPGELRNFEHPEGQPGLAAGSMHFCQ